MSKLYKLSTCGLTLNVAGPATVEAYDAKGGPDSCLTHAVAFIGRQVTISKIQNALIPKLEELTGIKRNVDEKATAAAQKRSKNPERVSPVLEKFKPYFERVSKDYVKNDADRRAEIELLAQEVADGFEIDPTPTPASLDLDKADFIKADEILARSPEDIRRTIERLLRDVPDFNLTVGADGKIDRTNLAHLIHIYSDV